VSEPTGTAGVDTAAAPPPPAGAPPRRSRWRPPRSWRERTDWLPPDTTGGQVLRGLRWGAIAVYVTVVIYYGVTVGIPFDREGLLLWIAIGLAVCSIGRHPVWLLWIVLDFVPFAAVLIAYDYLRGLSDTVGMPTWWHPQLDVDRWLFFGHEPTVWLQERLKHPDVRWYDVVVCLCYFSFFFLPYITAGVLWLRSRADFYRWTLRFVALSFFSFTLFLLTPSAPPWAAALCTAKDVANHPNDPACMNIVAHPVDGNLLGQFTTSQPGANPWTERIVGRGFFELHLSVAQDLLHKGYVVADPVAAVPSLHLGGTVLFVIFMWSRVNKWWRPVLVAYPILMVFSLVYPAEHYVADCIAGALAAWLIHVLANRVERWQKTRAAPDTLDSSSQQQQESPCPPTHPPSATMPSST
jgi:hypothetical protein